MQVLICLNHKIGEEQVKELNSYGYSHLGELPERLKSKLSNCPADVEQLEKLANELVEFILHNGYQGVVLPIGSPAFMFILSRKIHSVEVFFAHSERVSVEEKKEDGSVVKTSVFKHMRFIRIFT